MLKKKVKYHFKNYGGAGRNIRGARRKSRKTVLVGLQKIVVCRNVFQKFIN